MKKLSPPKKQLQLKIETPYNYYYTPLLLAKSTNCVPPNTLLANRTPTVKAIAMGGTCFAIGDVSTRRSSPLMI